MDTLKKFVANLYPVKNRTLARTWFIEYSIEGGPKLKKYGNLNTLPTEEERMEESARLMEIIKAEATNPQKEARAIAAVNTKKKRYLLQELYKVFESQHKYLREKTISTYKSKILHFQDWFFTSPHIEYTRDIMDEYLEFLRTEKDIKFKKNEVRSNRTINSYIGCHLTFFGLLTEKGIIKENPWKNIKQFPAHCKSWGYFNEKLQLELAQRISQVDPQLWLACQVQYYCLIRPKELRNLKISDLNIREASFHVESGIAKNKKSEFVRIPDCFIEQLQGLDEYPEDYYIFGKEGHPSPNKVPANSFYNRHRTILKEMKVNLKKYVFYSWKHTGAVMYYLATKDLKGLKEQGRWSSLDMVEEYLKNLKALEIPSIQKDYPPIGGKIAAAQIGENQAAA